MTRCGSESHSKYWEQHFFFTDLHAWEFSLFSALLKASGGDGGLFSLAKGEISRMTYLLATMKMCY